MPVFDGLFPAPHNRIVQQLLFACAHWHGLAKLRLHTDHTLNFLEKATGTLRTKFQAFEQKTCSAHTTRELPREAMQRQRRNAKASAKKGQPSNKAAAAGGHKVKVFKMATYKYHSLGDYVEMIRQYGTCDSYNTESVSTRAH